MKPTNQELKERVQLVAQLLATGATKTQIHKAIGEKYEVHWKTVDNYIARARELMAEEVNIDRTQHIAAAYAFYGSILRDTKVHPRERILARTRLDQLLGLDAPAKQEFSGPGGAAMKVEGGGMIVTPEALAKFAADIKQYEQPATG